jgi:hypothetical protein
LTYEFKEHISGSLINDLIETACLLAKSDHKEIVISSLNLLKILCSIFPQTTLAQFLEVIGQTVHNLHEKRASPANITESHNFNNVSPVAKSQQIRSFVKVILKKLMKKFSYEILHEKVFAAKRVSAGNTLTAVVKQGLENLLLNLKKSIEKDKQRKLDEQLAGKRSKKSSSANDDLISCYTTNKSHISTAPTNYNEVEDLLKESDDDDQETDIKSQKSSKTNKTNQSNKSNRKDKKTTGTSKKNKNSNLAWLQENENDDPLDLLDPLAMKRVLATKPLTKGELERKKDERNQVQSQE